MLVSTSLEIIPSLGKYSSGIIAGDYFIYFASHVLVFYLFYVFLTNAQLKKNRSSAAILYGIFVLLIISLPSAYILVYFISPDILELEGQKFLFTFGSRYLSILQTNLVYAVSGALLKLSLIWYENVIRQKESEKKRLKGELALLRSQINPRFLSNSLGHIRSLVVPNPARAIYGIENLSEIMSYMLYETSAELVPLDGEINYIRNYLKLQEARYGPGFVEFETSGITAGIMVPPLMFMPFLENIFGKSGIDSTEIPGIKISLAVKDNLLEFSARCCISDYQLNPEADKGFSFNSIKRFFDLQFGGNYTLETVEENNKYFVSAKVILTD